jgi:excisionase family DNA binding protein
VFTITEAAKKAGVSRAAIYKAIKVGRLTATKDDNKNYSIDAAELFRVFQPDNAEVTQPVTNGCAEVTDIKDSFEYQMLAQKLEFTQRLLWQTENERDRLVQVVALLGNQQQPEGQKSENKPVTSLLWKKLFGKR